MSFSVFFYSSFPSKTMKVFSEIHCSGGTSANISVKSKYHYKRGIFMNTLHGFIYAYWRSSQV
jgi:hypothetical protein